MLLNTKVQSHRSPVCGRPCFGAMRAVHEVQGWGFHGGLSCKRPPTSPTSERSFGEHVTQRAKLHLAASEIARNARNAGSLVGKTLQPEMGTLQSGLGVCNILHLQPAQFTGKWKRITFVLNRPYGHSNGASLEEQLLFKGTVNNQTRFGSFSDCCDYQQIFLSEKRLGKWLLR